uniref:Uncharacterized protein n=1 Tax=Hyaloperonospora arabidopsidis (strain Emoy2) TaxID=559515 RepID=M4BP48_HYAAE
MKAKLNQYTSKLEQEPAIIAAFLNHQGPKTTDPVKHERVVDLGCSTLQRRYSPSSTRAR